MDEFERNQGSSGWVFSCTTPGLFMMRMRIPNGILTSGRCGYWRKSCSYGNGAGFQDQGNADITTRQNLQLRGIRIEDTRYL